MMHRGGTIISYQWRQTGCVSAIAQATSITRTKKACLPVQRNILGSFRHSIIVHFPAEIHSFPCLSYFFRVTSAKRLIYKRGMSRIFFSLDRKGRVRA